MEKAQKFWSSLFDSLQVGIVLTDSHSRILQSNAMLGIYFGENGHGKYLGEFFIERDEFERPIQLQNNSDQSFASQIRIQKSKVAKVNVHSRICEDGESILWTILRIDHSEPDLKYESFKEKSNKAFWESDVASSTLSLEPVGEEIQGVEEKCKLSLEEALENRKSFLTKLGPLVETNGEIFGVEGIATDITEQKSILEQSQLANIRYEMVNKATNEAIFDWDLEKGTIYWGGSFDRLLGHKPSNGSKFSLYDWESWVFPDDLANVSSDLEMFLSDSSKDYWKAQYRIKNYQGRYFYVLGMGYLVRDLEGKAISMFGSIRDVNHEMVLKNRLKSSHQRLSEFKKALNQSTNVIITDLDGVILDVNQSTCDLSGYTKEELIGAHSRINRSGHHTKEFYKQMWETIKSGQEWKGELKNKRKDGSSYWIFTCIFPLRDINDKIYRFMAVRTDITDQKEAQEKVMKAFEKVKRSKKKYSDLFQNSPFPMWIYDVESLLILDVNHAALDNYGYTRKEFLKLTIFDLRPERELEKFQKSLKITPHEFGIFKQIFIHKKKFGEEIQVEISSIPVDVGGDKAKLVVANDITQALNYKEKIESQNEILKEIAWIQSHIVRAPLARLMALVNLIIQDVVDDKEKKEFISHIHTSALELDEVIKVINDKTNQLERK